MCQTVQCAEMENLIQGTVNDIAMLTNKYLL